MILWGVAGFFAVAAIAVVVYLLRPTGDGRGTAFPADAGSPRR